MRKQTLQINLDRRDNIVKIYLKVPPLLEDFFKKASNGKIEQSSVWQDSQGQPIKYYAMNTAGWKKLDTLIKEHGLTAFNDFGDGLFRKEGGTEVPNIAPLRIVGVGSGKAFTTGSFQSLDNLYLKDYVQKLGIITRDIWNAFIGEEKIRATISFEV